MPDRRSPVREQQPGSNGLLEFSQAIALERELLSALSLAEGAQGRILVWRTGKALIVPRGMPSRPHFEAAAKDAMSRGWPVFERDTGGDLTPQAPGMINVSLAFKDESPVPSIERAYRRLLEPIISYFHECMGLKMSAGSVAGSFCDGAYNLVFDGRKLGGTAQRWKMMRGSREKPEAHALAHIAIMADMPLADAIETINAFYEICGIYRRAALDRHVTLAEIVGPEQAKPEMIAAGIAHFLSHRKDAKCR